MKKYLALFLFIFGLGLIGQSWLSGVFSVRLKLLLSVLGLACFAAGVWIQWKSEPSESE
jgi:hypothetical protein